MVNITVCIFRRNLRAADNLTLARALRHHTASQSPSVFVPLYCLDVKKEWNRKWFNYPAWGMRRRCFLVESIMDLHTSLQQQLYVSHDDIPTALERLMTSIGADGDLKPSSIALFAPEEVGSFEEKEQRAIERLCKRHRIVCDFVWEATAVSRECLYSKYAPNAPELPPGKPNLNNGMRANETAFLSGNAVALRMFCGKFPNGYTSFRKSVEHWMGDPATASTYVTYPNGDPGVCPPLAKAHGLKKFEVPENVAGAMSKAGLTASMQDMLASLRASGDIPKEDEFNPSLNTHGEVVDPQEFNLWRGGERAGALRIKKFIWDTDAVATYKATRNRSIGDVFSSKFSMWLAHGCISARQVIHEIAKYEQERIYPEAAMNGNSGGANGGHKGGRGGYGNNYGNAPAPQDARLASTYWVVFELMWRDFTTLAPVQVGARLFDYGGIRRAEAKWERGGSYPVLNRKEDFKAWCEGRTGFPLVDAAMRELAATGFMSNRCRQNVASFLVYNLGIDWRWGGEFFEHSLIDHQVGANYVNWQTVSGVGWQQRDNVFNVIKQAVTYEPDAAYFRKWITPDASREDDFPDLTTLPDHYIHAPWDYNGSGFDAQAWRKRMVRPPNTFFYNTKGMQDDIKKAKAAQGVNLDIGNTSYYKAKKYGGRSPEDAGKAQQQAKRQKRKNRLQQ